MEKEKTGRFNVLVLLLVCELSKTSYVQKVSKILF